MPIAPWKNLSVLIVTNDDGDFRTLSGLLAADARARYTIERTRLDSTGIDRLQQVRDEVVVLAHAEAAAALSFIRAAATNRPAPGSIFIAPQIDTAAEEAAFQAGAAECLTLGTLQSAELGRAIHRSVRHAERRWLEFNLLHTGDAERQRLGSELHDELAQRLAGLAFMAGALRDRLKTTLPQEVAATDELAGLARDALRRARAVAHGLHPVQFEEHGLASALNVLAAQSQSSHGITCGFQRRGSLPVREHSAELHLYRIAQEAVRNAISHGAVRRIAITLASCGTAHRLTVADDGRGFDPAQVRASVSGCGLRLMAYRATIIAGEFTVRSRPGCGARVACRFSSSSLS